MEEILTLIISSSESTWCLENRNMMNIFWMCIFTTALPISVAPKKVQKGMRKWPQVIPARSKSGFGIEAAARMPKNPARWTKSCMNSLPRVMRSSWALDALLPCFWASRSSWNSFNSSSSSSWTPNSQILAIWPPTVQSEFRIRDP